MNDNEAITTPAPQERDQTELPKAISLEYSEPTQGDDPRGGLSVTGTTSMPDAEPLARLGIPSIDKPRYDPIFARVVATPSTEHRDAGKTHE